MTVPQTTSDSPLPNSAKDEGRVDRFPAADPWQGWGGILGLTIAVLLFQVGCSAFNSTPPLTGLGKNLVGRWERTGGTSEVLIFGADGTFVQLRGRTEKLAREVDGWTFSTPSGGRWDVVISSGSSQVGGIKCEFRDDEELEISDGFGLKTNLKGTYRRLGGATSEGPPPKAGSMAEKLNQLKEQVAKVEKGRDELKKARVSLEKQRVDKLNELRRAGVPAGTPPEKLTPAQKVIDNELNTLVKLDGQLKSKIDEMEATMSKFRSVITKLNVKLVIDGNEPTGDDLSEINAAKVALKMAEEDLDGDGTPSEDPLVEKILKEHRAPEEKPVGKEGK